MHPVLPLEPRPFVGQQVQQENVLRRMAELNGAGAGEVARENRPSI
jgi:hypothetical protein